MTSKSTLDESFLTFFVAAEFVVLSTFILPCRTTKQWNQLLKSKFGRFFADYGSYIFYPVMSLLAIFLLNSVINLANYAGIHWLDRLEVNNGLFRNQVNFYKAALAIFNIFVIRRFLVLVTTQTRLKKEKRKAKINALGALAAFHTLAEVVQNSEVHSTAPAETNSSTV